MTVFAAFAVGCAGPSPAQKPAPANGETAGLERADTVAPEAPDAQDVPETSDAPAVEVSSAADLKKKNEALIDRAQRGVNNVILATVRKTDNLFGVEGVEEEASVTRGRFSVGGQYDQRDAFKTSVRLKARVRLPALEERASLVFGRGSADDFVDGSDDDNVDTLPNRFNDFQDDDWLLGIGFSRDKAMRRGWSFGAGVRMATPVEPYVHATYRWARALGDNWLWRVEPRFFVQSQRGAGLSLQNTLDFAANENWLLRWWTIAVADDPIEGVAWTTKLAAYRNLTHKSAISYATYYSGETAHEVPIRDYGLEVRFRRQISRDWLFIELLGRVNWPREFAAEQRVSNLGVGIEFEMQFGQWPGRPESP